MCHPEPLKMIPAAEKTLRSRPSHDGHSVRASSEKDWTMSNWWPQSLQAYS